MPPKFGEKLKSRMPGDEQLVKDYDFKQQEKKKYTYFYTKAELEQ